MKWLPIGYTFVEGDKYYKVVCKEYSTPGTPVNKNLTYVQQVDEVTGQCIGQAFLITDLKRGSE